jgi:hypothetical protein
VTDILGLLRVGILSLRGSVTIELFGCRVHELFEVNRGM